MRSVARGGSPSGPAGMICGSSPGDCSGCIAMACEPLSRPAQARSRSRTRQVATDREAHCSTHPGDLPVGREGKNPVNPAHEKYSAFPKSRSAVWSKSFRSDQGAYASSRTWSGTRWTRDVPDDVRHVRGRRNRVVLARPCKRQVLAKPKGIARATVTTRGSPGRSRISRKPLRREGRLSPPVPVVFALSRNSLARGPRVQRPPGSPCSLRFCGGDNDDARLGRNAPRERGIMPAPRAESAGTNAPAPFPFSDSNSPRTQSRLCDATWGADRVGGWP